MIFDVDPASLRNLLDSLFDGVYVVDEERRITYWNRGAERLTGRSAEEMLGSVCGGTVAVHSACGGGSEPCPHCPVHVMRTPGPTLERELLLHHRDGHLVPVLARASALTDADGTLNGVVEVFTDNSSSADAAEEVRRLRRIALLDPLTEVGNRRFGEIALDARVDELRRYDWSFGLLFVDIDHFKAVNDEHGHQVGDAVLRMVARTLVGSVRASDRVVRWGGDEFLVVARNVDGSELAVIAQKVRRLVELASFDNGGRRVAVTVSIGAAAGRRDDTATSLVERADTLMYLSKRRGRNCVSMDGDG